MDLNALYAAFFADPMYFIGIIFSLWAAWGFGLFVAGLASGGLRHVLAYSEQQSHVDHARTHLLQGLFLSMTAFGGWELVRVIAGEVSWTYLWLSFLFLSPLWWPWLQGLWGGGKKSGGGH